MGAGQHVAVTRGVADVALSRRDFLGAVALGSAGLRTAGGAGGDDAAAPFVYVGTYTNDGRSRGIHRYRMHPDSGALRPAGAVTVAANPSFLAVHPNRRFLYAVNEITEFEGQPSGAVTSFAVDQQTGALTPLNQRASHGGAPCYVTIDRTGRFALVANYVGGSVAILPIRADGSVGEATSVVQHTGSGPHPERQRSPHAHCIVVDTANRHALVADLGTDRVTAYPFDARRGTLTQAGASHAALTPGAGPRHLAFHPSGRVVYVANELDSTLSALRYTPETGALGEMQTIPLITPAAQRNAPADVHVAPSGRFLYLSNRGQDG
ncbi:MAG: lactonase family protein, partial [Gemmatimonadaceae bacterium]